MKKVLRIEEMEFPVFAPSSVCFSSGKGGVGKTSISINTALALVDRGFRVLLVDGDLGLANVDVMLGLSVQTTMRDIIANDEDPRTVLVYPEPNLAVLPASSGVPDMVNLGPEDQAVIGQILQVLSADFDLVFVDVAAGIGPSVLWFNTVVHHNVVVITPDPTSITDAYALIKVLMRDHNRRRFYLVANMVRNEKEGIQVCQGLIKVVKKFLNVEPEYLGFVPRDNLMARAVRDQVPAVRSAETGKADEAIRKLAARMARGL